VSPCETGIFPLITSRNLTPSHQATKNITALCASASLRLCVTLCPPAPAPPACRQRWHGEVVARQGGDQISPAEAGHDGPVGVQLRPPARVQFDAAPLFHKALKRGCVAPAKRCSASATTRRFTAQSGAPHICAGKEHAHEDAKTRRHEGNRFFRHPVIPSSPCTPPVRRWRAHGAALRLFIVKLPSCRKGNTHLR